MCSSDLCTISDDRTINSTSDRATSGWSCPRQRCDRPTGDKTTHKEKSTDSQKYPSYDDNNLHHQWASKFNVFEKVQSVHTGLIYTISRPRRSKPSFAQCCNNAESSSITFIIIGIARWSLISASARNAWMRADCGTFPSTR